MVRYVGGTAAVELAGRRGKREKKTSKRCDQDFVDIVYKQRECVLVYNAVKQFERQGEGVATGYTCAGD